MKSSIKFFSIVLSLLFASTIALSGCMYAIQASGGSDKPYEMDSDIVASGDEEFIVDTPISQSDLQKKFSGMYEIDEETNTITVVSEDYLKKYWNSNYKKEVIRSLSYDEVMYIIQDSIRLYNLYDKIVLNKFAFSQEIENIFNETPLDIQETIQYYHLFDNIAYSTSKPSSVIDEIAKRFPFVKEQIITSSRNDYHKDYYKDCLSIKDIILYRLAVLSSPKAFIPAAEAIIFSGGNPAAYSSLYPETLFYVPGFSAETDRESLLNSLSGKKIFTKIEEHVDLFRALPRGSSHISFLSKENAETVFPTAEMEERKSVFYSDGDESTDENS